VFPAGAPGGEEVVIELSQPSDTEIEEPYAVELRTVEVATSILRPATRLAEPLPLLPGAFWLWSRNGGSGPSAPATSTTSPCCATTWTRRNARASAPH